MENNVYEITNKKYEVIIYEVTISVIIKQNYYFPKHKG